MMHARHAMPGDDGGGRHSPQITPRRTSSANRTKKQKEPLHGSTHSESTTETSKHRNYVMSHKRDNSQSSFRSPPGDEFGHASYRTHGSQNSNGSPNFHASYRTHGSHNSNGSSNFHETGQFPGSHQFNSSVQQFHASVRSSSSATSRQSPGQAGDYVPATPQSVRRRKGTVPATPQRKSPVKSSNRSNPQTPSGASPMKKKIPRKKPGDDSHNATERSTSTRTSYVSSSLNGSQEFAYHHHYSSDDGEMDGMRPRGAPVKKRRPKTGDSTSSNGRRPASITENEHEASNTSPVPASPNRGNGNRVVKKKPRKPGEPQSPRRTASREDVYDHLYTSADNMEQLASGDDEYQAAPRPTPRRRPKKKMSGSMPGARAQQAFDEIPETPVTQRVVPSQIPRTPARSASQASSEEELRLAPSRRISFDTQFTNSSLPNGQNTTKLYEYARRCQWDEVMREVELNPRDAKTVGEKDGTTALHLAVMSRTNPMMRDGRVGEFKPAPLELIEMLVKACPEAGSTRCTRKRYTPLAYACLVADHGYDMDDCSEMVLILLKHAPGSVYVFTDDGFSAVDIHILSYSQIHKQKEEVYSGGRTSTVVLRTLLAEQPDLAESRVYKSKVRGPIELLYRCNTTEFQDAMIDDLTGEANDVKKKQLKSRFGSVASVLSDWWAWKWVLLLLKFSTIKDKKPGTIFSAVQAAARLVACPLPILALAINTFPHQVEERDPRGEIYNLPLHEVCSWRADEAILSGDPFVAGRKLKAIQLLLNEYPEAARMTNNMGETPLQLAVESCTPWHGGLELLVESCPKALKFPRKLRMGDQGLCLSVLNPSALDSVASYDSDEVDPMAAMEGMYPFALAAVLGGVAANKRRIPFDYTEEQKAEHIKQLKQKELQAVRTVFGLLRSRPDVLEKYRKDVTRDYLRMLKQMEND